MPVALGATVVQSALYDVPGGYRAVLFDRFSGVKPVVCFSIYSGGMCASVLWECLGRCPSGRERSVGEWSRGAGVLDLWEELAGEGIYDLKEMTDLVNTD